MMAFPPISSQPVLAIYPTRVYTLEGYSAGVGDGTQVPGAIGSKPYTVGVLARTLAE
jgi:hypothetical protein